jgi:hypothetical protein
MGGWSNDNRDTIQWMGNVKAETFNGDINALNSVNIGDNGIKKSESPTDTFVIAKLGSEQLTNGNFATNSTGWSLFGNASYNSSGANLLMSNKAGGTGATQSISLPNGWYYYSYTITNYTGTLPHKLRIGANFATALNIGNGTFTGFAYTTSISFVELRTDNGSGSFNVDNISVKSLALTNIYAGEGHFTNVYGNGSNLTNIAAGSDTQVQYNSSGNLAGSSNMVFDGTNLFLDGGGALRAGTNGLSIGNTSGGVSNFNLCVDSGSGIDFEGSGNGFQHVGFSLNNTEYMSIDGYGAIRGIGIFNHDAYYPLDINGSTSQLTDKAVVSAHKFNDDGAFYRIYEDHYGSSYPWLIGTAGSNTSSFNYALNGVQAGDFLIFPENDYSKFIGISIAGNGLILPPSGGSPSNSATPAGWIDCYINGTSSYIPYYQ